MNLTTKVISVIVVIFATYAIAEVLVQRFVVFPSFVHLEESEAQEDHGRGIQALDREIAYLDTMVRDWTAWDDTYQFMADRNDAYRSSNLTGDPLTTLEVDAVIYYDIEERVVWFDARDPDTSESLVAEVFAPPRQGVPHPLTAFANDQGLIRGVYTTPRGPLLVASRPILTSNASGPRRGAVVMGKFIGADLVRNLAERARVDLEILPVKADRNIDEAVHIETTEDTLVLTSVRDDIIGNGAFTIKVNVPRDITRQGTAATHYALASVGASGLVVLLVLVFTMKRMVLDPLTCLTHFAEEIGDSDGQHEPIDLKAQDELGTLAQAFNDMMARLAEARRRLAAQSHSAGVAEMASGVLHNIGNAITPVNTHLVNSVTALKGLPIKDIEMAAEQLQGEIGDEKRRDLVKFISLAGQHADKISASLADTLTRAESHLNHVLKILASQEQLSRAEKVYDHIELAALVSEGIAVMRHEAREILDVVVDDSVHELGKIRIPSIVIIQIITNIAVNAAESIKRAGRDKGVLRIFATEETGDDKAVVHLGFEDDGAGIAPEDLARIFEKGFSTKQPSPSGLGLHWCGNILNGLHGSIAAESDGPGRGATLHVKFPLQRTTQTNASKKVA